MAHSQSQQAIDFSRLRINNHNNSNNQLSTGDISRQFGHFRRSDGAANHHHRQATTAVASSGHHKGHQRRQSVARLLPDISKLRLLSWLVEASNELINCDIAIMDGVYAKLNRSRESLLFWQQTNNNNNSAFAGPIFNHHHHQQQQQQVAKQPQLPPPPPPPPSSQPVANKFVISKQQQRQTPTTSKKKLAKSMAGNKTKVLLDDARTHHSLPLTNYDASSLAAVSMRSSKTMPTSTSESSKRAKRLAAAATKQQVAARLSLQETSDLSKQCDRLDDEKLETSNNVAIGEQAHEHSDEENNNDDDDDGEEEEEEEEEEDYDGDEDDDRSSSSTASSGIPNASMSSSASSSSASSSASSSCGSSSFVAYSASADPIGTQQTRQPNTNVINSQQQASSSSTNNNNNNMTSAEYLSERIRQTLMEHNYLQGLLVNIIRQHDKRRDLMILSRHQTNTPKPLIRVDLADIADSLDDGCLCSCHSSQFARSRSGRNQTTRASTLPNAPTASGGSSPSQVANNTNNSGRKATTLTSRRRVKKLKQSGNSSELSRDDLIQKMSDKLCENCFETHYWLHGSSSMELTGGSHPVGVISSDSLADEQQEAANNQQQTKLQEEANDALVSLRNATFIKLVQQQVRTTISKSIELIDLIRKEIKSPDSIKQKQLMRYFSSSIQLLSSVANYVVPSQDISSFIPPEVDQHHRNQANCASTGANPSSLFNLPPQDFDHVLLLHHSHAYPSSGQNVNYHLAQAPEIPPRRRQLVNAAQRKQQLLLDNNKLDKGQPDSSSGASSNNSSASSSIARSQVQSSLLRATQDQQFTPTGPPPRPQPPTTSSLLRQHKKQQQQNQSGLSLDSMAVMASRQQSRGQDDNDQDDNLFFQSSKCSAKFWQSSKFNFIRKLLHVKQQRLLRQQSKDRRIYNNKVQNKFRLVMMDLTHFNKSQQLLTTENGVNSLLTSMRNVAEFGLYLTLKLY